MRAENGLSAEQAVAVLDRMRRAYREWDAARHELLEGLLPLVRDAAPRPLWGALWIGLATAIDRLTRNQESDLLKCVVEELERTERRVLVRGERPYLSPAIDQQHAKATRQGPTPRAAATGRQHPQQRGDEPRATRDRPQGKAQDPLVHDADQVADRARSQRREVAAVADNGK